MYSDLCAMFILTNDHSGNAALLDASRCSCRVWWRQRRFRVWRRSDYNSLDQCIAVRCRHQWFRHGTVNVRCHGSCNFQPTCIRGDYVSRACHGVDVCRDSCAIRSSGYNGSDEGIVPVRCYCSGGYEWNVCLRWRSGTNVVLF